MNVSFLSKIGHFFLAFFFFLILSAGLGEWSQVGSHIHQVVSELPLLLLMYFLLYTMQKNNQTFLKRFLIAILPIVILYLIYDYYFLTFNAPFRISYFTNVFELIEVLSFWQIIVALLVLGLPLLLVFWSIDIRKKTPIYSFVSVVGFIAITLVYFPKQIINYVEAITPGNFYQHTLVMDNGRFIATLYSEAKRRLALEQLSFTDGLLNDSRLETLSKPFSQTSTPNKDVFIVVLESFVNKQDFKGLQMISVDGFDDKLTKKIEFSHSLSPVFGGLTPRAEFEVLCGVPSYAKFGANEFDLIENDGLSCLPNILKRQGYLTIATNPYKPIYFNEKNAYHGLGFEDINFLEQFSGNSESYLKMRMPTKGYVFDGDLFKENVNYLKDIKEKNPDKPIFSYIMTLYGHTPFYLVNDQKPVFEHNSTISSALNRSLNLSAYTEQALSNYLEAIHKISPNALVLVLGDHLPPMPRGKLDYEQAGLLGAQANKLYQTPRLFMDNQARLFQNSPLKHYEFFDLILDNLQDGKLCEKQSCQHSKETLSNLYDSIMFKAMTQK